MLERERDNSLLRSIMVGGLEWFLLGKVRGQDVPCQFCGAPDGDGHLVWECTFPPLVEIRENPEFHDLMGMEKGHCLGVCFGMVGFLSCLVSREPLLGLLVLLIVLVTLLNLLLVATLLVFFAEWGPSDEHDAVEAASLLPDHPNVLTDGSLVLDRVTGVSSPGAGFFCS